MLPKCNYPFLFILILLFSCVARTKENLITFPDGGYAYPQVPYPSDSNFYWYPLKMIVSPKDSITMVYGGSYLFRALDEPNLSLRPQSKITFRLICSYPTAIITINESELIVKQVKTGSVYAYTDENKLTKDEYYDLNFLNIKYPLMNKNIKYRAWENKWLDSLVGARPELLAPQYYLSLLEKSKAFYPERVSYDTKKMPLSAAAFKKIVDTINASGYWSHSFEVPCNSYPSDVSSYILEANTPEKYNMVQVEDCETNYSSIATVYQYLFNLADLEKKVHILGTR